MTTHRPPDGYKLLEGSDGRFGVHIGPLYIDERKALSPRFAFLPHAHHANAAGVVHGGMLLALSDQVLGLTVRVAAASHAVVTISLTSEFVTAARLGKWIEGCAEVVHQTRTLVFVRGTLTSEGIPVMTSNGIWKKVRG
jgi:uncharacterized protein (TIGR00369 family)